MAVVCIKHANFAKQKQNSNKPASLLGFPLPLAVFVFLLFAS